jgi:hypothetical protein
MTTDLTPENTPRKPPLPRTPTPPLTLTPQQAATLVARIIAARIDETRITAAKFSSNI